MDNIKLHISSLRNVLPFYIVLNSEGLILDFGGNRASIFMLSLQKNVEDYFKVNALNADSASIEKLLLKSKSLHLQCKTNNLLSFDCNVEPIENGMLLLIAVNVPFLSNSTHTKMRMFNSYSLWELLMVEKANVDNKFIDEALNYYVLKNIDMKVLHDIEIENTSSVTLSNEKGIVIWCNKEFEELTGRLKSEIIGHRPRNAMYGQKSVYIDKKYVDRNVETGKPFYFENIAYHQSGKEYWFSAKVYPLTDYEGKIIGRVHVMRDITNIKINELQLEQNESLLSIALEASKGGVWIYNIVLNDLEISDNVKTMLLQHNLPDFSTKSLFKLLGRKNIINLKKQSNNISYEYANIAIEFFLDNNNNRRYFSAEGKCIQWDSIGKPVLIVGTVLDITEQKNIINSIEEQKQFYNSILDQIPSDIVIWDINHKYKYINYQAINNDEIRSWLIDKDDFDYCKYRNIDMSIAQNRRDQFNSIIRSKKPIRFIEKFVRNGNVSHKLRVMHPMLKNGEIDYVIGYGIDITEQITKKEYAELQERKIKKILDVTSDAIITLNHSGILQQWNKAFIDLFNIKTDYFPWYIYEVLSAKDSEKFKVKLQSLIDTNEVQYGQITYSNHSSEKIINYIILYSEDYASTGEVMCRMSDITEAFLKEKMLESNIAREIQLNEYKSQFIRISSHELRTPLAVIKSNSELLNLQISNSTENIQTISNKYIDRIIHQVDKMTEILNHLLMISKIESGNLPLNLEEIEIQDFINNDVAKNFNPYLDGRYLVVKFNSITNTIRIDRQLFQLALINIINNAFKYSMNSENPILEVSQNSDYTIFKIVDKGLGIPDDDKGELFKPFYRASNTNGISGTGIGLTVVDFMVKIHSGMISIDSKQNFYTAVTIQIPYL